MGDVVLCRLNKRYLTLLFVRRCGGGTASDRSQGEKKFGIGAGRWKGLVAGVSGKCHCRRFCAVWTD